MISSVTADYSLYLSAVPFRDVTTSQIVSYVERCKFFNRRKEASENDISVTGFVLFCFFLLLFFTF